MVDEVDNGDADHRSYNSDTESSLDSKVELETTTYTRRNGNCNIDGQYYESKLLALVLLRLQNDPRVKSFELGANVAGFDKFDDLVCKVVYHDRAGEPVWWFIQLKHRENVERKKITIDTLSDKSEDFSWHAYFKNYLNLRRELVRTREMVIFSENEFESADVKLIYYTTTLEDIDTNNSHNVKRSEVPENDLLNTSKDGKVIFLENTAESIESLIESSDFTSSSLIKVGNEEKTYKSLASDFLNKFCFYSGQAKQEQVEEILKKEISQKVGNCEPDCIFEKYHKIVQDYWKASNRVAVLTENCTIFETAVNNAKFKSFNEVYRHKVALLRIKFRAEILSALDFIADPTRQFINIYSDAPTITGAKLFECFIAKEPKSFVFVDSGDICEELDVLSAFENQSQFKKLVIICNNGCDFANICPRVSNMTLNDKNVIIVRKHPSNNVLGKEPGEITNQNNNLSELTEECQNRVLRKFVRLQGKSTQLIGIVGEMDDKFHVPRSKIGGELLLDLLENKEVTIFPGETEFPNLGETKCYIDRKFSVCKTISRDILQDSSFCTGDEVSDDERREIIVISDTRDRFEKLWKLNKNRKIHWLMRKQGQLVWKESTNGLKNLRPYLDKIETHFEVNSMNDVKDRVTILAGEPGVGKSTIISRLVDQTLRNDDAFVIRIDLLNNIKIFDKLINVSKDYDGALKYLAFNLFQTSQINQTMYFTDLQKSIFERFSNMGKVFLLFDGYDELNATLFEHLRATVRALLKTCVTCNIGKLLITTRSTGIEAELEEELSVIAHTLVPFTKENSLCLIEHHLSTTWDSFEPGSPEQFANHLLRIFGELNPLETEIDVLSFPLHCYWVAKCSEKSFQEFSTPNNKAHIDNFLNRLNITEFFVSITKLKHLVHLKEKCELSIRNPNFDKNETYGNFTNRYKQIALEAFFSEDVLKILSNPAHENPDISSEILEREGIISRIVCGKPQFVHIAFGHFFAAVVIFEYFETSCLEMFEIFLEKVLIEALIGQDKQQVCMFVQLLAFTKSHCIAYLGNKAFMLLESLNESKLGNRSFELLLGIVEVWLTCEPNCSQVRKIINDQTNNERMHFLQISSKMEYACLETIIQTNGKTQIDFFS